MSDLTPNQVAVRSGVSVSTVYGWIRGGRLRAHRVGRQYRVREAALEQSPARLPGPDQQLEAYRAWLGARPYTPGTQVAHLSGLRRFLEWHADLGRPYRPGGLTPDLMASYRASLTEAGLPGRAIRQRMSQVWLLADFEHEAGRLTEGEWQAVRGAGRLQVPDALASLAEELERAGVLATYLETILRSPMQRSTRIARLRALCRYVRWLASTNREPVLDRLSPRDVKTYASSLRQHGLGPRPRLERVSELHRYGRALADAGLLSPSELASLEAIVVSYQPPARGRRSQGHLEALARARTAQEGRVVGRLAGSANHRATWDVPPGLRARIRALPLATSTQSHLLTGLVDFADWYERSSGKGFREAALRAEQLEEYLDFERHMLRRPSTLASRWDALQHLAAWAAQEGRLRPKTAGAILAVSKPSYRHSEEPDHCVCRRVVESVSAEGRRILEAVSHGSARDQLLVRLLLHVGLGPGEATRLTRADFEDGPRATLEVRDGPRRPGRIIPLPRSIRDRIRSLLEAHPAQPSAPLLEGRQGRLGHPVEAVLAFVVELAGVRATTGYWRRMFSVRFAGVSDGDRKALAAVLGVPAVRVDGRPLAASPSRVRRHLERMEG